MKKNLLIFLLLVSFNSFSQIPPPPPCLTFDKIDSDNDGFVVFEIDYYLNYIRDHALNLSYNLSGYNLVLFPSDTDYNNNSNPITTNNYQNIEANTQFCSLKLTYSGSGNYYDEPNLLYYFSCHILATNSSNGDFDNDNIVNSIEDLNSNLILIDDDTDGDRIANYRDIDDDGDLVNTIDEDYNGNGNFLDDDLNGNSIPDYLDNLVSGNLSVLEILNSKFKIYPNPTSNFIEFETSSSFNLKIINTKGQIINSVENCKNKIDISYLESGIYFFKIEFENNFIIKKVVKI
ncbi:T9SS type A sorting domain-containing protein [Flavobacterium sp.]|uniref:T9SS type A sorting domain-containing protein n=1 Tax=Flavobacterium sp. TaxID=239 RepID=UPI003750FA19